MLFTICLKNDIFRVIVQISVSIGVWEVAFTNVYCSGLSFVVGNNIFNGIYRLFPIGVTVFVFGVAIECKCHRETCISYVTFGKSVDFCCFGVVYYAEGGGVYQYCLLRGVGYLYNHCFFPVASYSPHIIDFAVATTSIIKATEHDIKMTFSVGVA